MKSLVLILIMIISDRVLAGNSCFQSQPIIDLIEASKALDICFASDDNPCAFKEKTIEEQKVRNSRRLVPYDRESGDSIMNTATGIVQVNFGKYSGRDSEQEVAASGQKISRCHIITSAHLLYTDAKLPVNSNNLTIQFQTGQTCDQRNPYKESVSASVHFNMVDENTDFVCGFNDKYGKCEMRLFYGHSDLVILKLNKYDKKDPKFFSLNTTDPNGPNKLESGQRVNCWGYPGHKPELKLDKEVSDLFLWHQTDAQIFGDNNGQYSKGMLTNAMGYHGMSGGGCAIASKPTELVGLFANPNKVGGRAAIDITPGKAIATGANFLSNFHVLEKRYFQKTGKHLSDLDKECD